MNHPEVLLLPLLMIADYYLTILGAVLHKKQYGKHFVIETYELNPEYREEIDSVSLVNLRFVGQVLLNFLILFSVAILSTDTYQFIYQIALGFYLTLFGYINGLHVSNILTFLFVKNNPNTFEGSLKIPHKFNLRRSLYNNSILFFPIGFILLFSFSYFVLGALFAVIYNFLLGSFWLKCSK